MGLDNFLIAFSKFISRNHLVTVHIVQRIYKPAQELMVLYKTDGTHISEKRIFPRSD